MGRSRVHEEIDDAARRRIVDLAARGLSYPQIASRFGIGPSRVSKIVKDARQDGKETES